MKICKKCNLELWEESFPIKQTLPNGKRLYRGVCKLCVHIEKMPYTVSLPPNTKVCSICKNIKLIKEIAKETSKCVPCYNQSRRKDLVKIEFKSCVNCKIEKHIDDFRNRRNQKDSIYKNSICKTCENKRRGIRYKIKQEIVIKDARYYADLERIKYHRFIDKRLARVNKYGITLEQLSSMELDQNDKCYLCNKEAVYSNHGVLAIDHCHKTGKVRKLLCTSCNAILGTVKDNSEFLRKCATYLEEYI